MGRRIGLFHSIRLSLICRSIYRVKQAFDFLILYEFSNEREPIASIVAAIDRSCGATNVSQRWLHMETARDELCPRLAVCIRPEGGTGVVA